MKTIVLGPPGTGKTTTLLNEVDRYLKQTDPDKIGYFSFTQKAAHEARECNVLKYGRSPSPRLNLDMALSLASCEAFCVKEK